MMKIKHIALLGVLTVGCSLGKAAGDEVKAASPALTSGKPARFGEDGRLVRPTGYRSWVYVGTPLTPNDMNDGRAAFPEFHSVYVDPEGYEHYKLTGEWRDGTVLLKELTSVGGKSASSGLGYFQGRFLGLEAAVKDVARFPAEPDNWGYFRFTDEAGGAVHDTAVSLPTSACATCHAANAADEMVFTQYYPVLRAAKSFGQGEPEDG